MMRNVWLCAVMMLASVVPAMAQRGAWRAESTTAKSITGDVALSDTKLTINFVSFSVAPIRPLTPAEASAAFDADSNAGGSGSLYRLSIPASVKFLHKNTMCGDEDTQWMATYMKGRELQIVFFSGAHAPVLTAEAMGASTDVCGVYSYSK